MLLTLNPDGALADDGAEVTYFRAHARSGFVSRGLTAAALVQVWRHLDEVGSDSSADLKTLAEGILCDKDDASVLIESLIARKVLVVFPTSSAKNDPAIPLRVSVCGDETLRTRLATDVRAAVDGAAASEPVERAVLVVAAESPGTLATAEADGGFDADVDVIVAVETLTGATRLDAWNRAALARGIPLLPVILSPDLALLGPVVFPAGSACFSCFWTRLTADDDPGLSRRMRQAAGNVRTTRVSAVPFTIGVAGTVVARELVLLAASKLGPQLLGKVLRFGLDDYSATSHPVLPVPGCSSCAMAAAGGRGDVN